jgi:hypothetical protein
MQEEQKEAEKWLQQRKEQERRDAEFARTLQESWFEPEPEPSHPSTASSSPAPAYFGQYGSAPMQQSSVPGSYYERTPLPPLGFDYHLSLPGPGPGPQQQNPFQTLTERPSNPHPQKSIHQRPTIALNESSDSDIAEISPLDFQRSMRQASMLPPSRSSKYIQPDAEMLQEVMDLTGVRTPSLVRPHPHHFASSNPFIGPNQAAFPWGEPSVVRNTFNKIMEAGKGLLTGTSMGKGDNVNPGKGPSTWPYDQAYWYVLLLCLFIYFIHHLTTV